MIISFLIYPLTLVFFLEFIKNIITNNDFLLKVFIPLVKNSKNKKEILNWFFNFLFCYTIIFSIIILPILWINNYLIVYLFLLILIINIFFIISLKIFYIKKYFFIKGILLFYYLIIFIINSNQVIEENTNYLLIALINLFEIIIIIFIIKDNISIKPDISYLNDLRNFYFSKKFIKNLLKNQVLKYFIFFIFLLNLYIIK